MHGPSLITLILVASLAGAVPAVPAVEPGLAARQVADARRALGEKHPAVAISLLETALADPGLTSPADKAAVLSLLGQAYEAAANQADAAGRPVDADSLRENARILRRKTGAAAPSSAPKPAPALRPAATAPVSAPAPAPVAEPPAVEPAPVPADAPLALPEMAIPAGSAQPATEAAGDTPTTAAPTEVAPTPAAAPPEPAGPGLAEADAAFRARRYAEAGRIYADLARDGRLPEDRREHWAYCRSSEVARRIDAKPKSEAEWASIDAEIAEIRVLAPHNWLGDYLRNRAAARPSARKTPKAGSTVVRAASPEEPAPRPGRAARQVPAQRPTSEVADVPAPGTVAAAPAAQPVPGAPIGRWRIRESANFRVFHADPKLAEQVVQVAEAVRRDQTKRWSGSLPAAPWQPRCEIYLYPTAQQYAQMTGQPEDSPGFSTMGMNEGQIISRRVNLRTDHDGLLAAVLPHEVTHVILADFFTDQQIPRWADEGMAVLTEPATEQKRRAADLVEPLGRNLLFPIETLMKMDYPDNQYWNLYYAQSVSLTRFLVDQGGPAQLVQFLQGAQTKGFEAELRRVYKINDFADLQARWVVYARNNLEPPTATAANPPRAEARAR